MINHMETDEGEPKGVVDVARQEQKDGGGEDLGPRYSALEARISQLSPEQKDALKKLLRTEVVKPIVQGSAREGVTQTQLPDAFDAFVDRPNAETADEASSWSTGVPERFQRLLANVESRLTRVEQGK